MNRFADSEQENCDRGSWRPAPAGRNAADALEEDEAFRRLAAATIWKAVEDARGDDGQVAFSAVRWLSRDTTEGLTLERCCQLLGLAPDHVQSSLHERFEKIRARMSRYRKVRLLSAGAAADGAMYRRR